MADVLVSGIKISEMELVNDISGSEKIPTDQIGDKAVSIDQILIYVNNKVEPYWGNIKGDISKQTDLMNMVTGKDNIIKLDLQNQIDDIQTQIDSLAVGNYAFQTYAEMDAAKATLPANSLVRVTNDPNPENNGDWQWNGTVFKKSIYDPLQQAKNYTDVKSREIAKEEALIATANILLNDSNNTHEFLDSEGYTVATITDKGTVNAQDFQGDLGKLSDVNRAVSSYEDGSLQKFSDKEGYVVAEINSEGTISAQNFRTDDGDLNSITSKIMAYDIPDVLHADVDVEGNILSVIKSNGVRVDSIETSSYGISEFRAGVANSQAMNDVGTLIDDNLVQGVAPLKFSVTVSPFLADETRHQRMPNCIRVGKNRLYVAFTQFSTMSTDQSNGRLVGRFVDFDLEAQTATVSETIPIIGEKIGSLYRHPHFIRLKDRILLIFNGLIGELFVWESFDECQTWQPKTMIDCTDPLPWATAIDSAVLIEDGRYKGRIVLSLFRYAADGYVGTVYSDDDGVTWKRGQTIRGSDYFPDYPSINETSVAVDAQQNLIFVIRNEESTPESRYLIFAKSTDGGETFEIFEQNTRTPAIACQTGLKQTSPLIYDGLPRIIATCPTTGGGNREGFRFRISYDNCKSFAREYKPFAENLRVGYSMVLPLDSTTYALVYEEGTMNASQSIRITFLNLAEVI